MYGTRCPQVNESLLTTGSPSHDPVVIRKLLDQMSELGFESHFVTCWPGTSHDNLDPAYVAKWRAIADYAKDRSIIVSGYELNLVQLLGSGGQAHLRANRLYDTERTRQMVREWVDWYKR